MISEPDPFVAHEDAIRSKERLGALDSTTEAALRAYFRGEEDAYAPHDLHYGSDLDGCARKTWYRLHDAPQDELSLGDQIRFHGGRLWGRAFVDALTRSGARVLREVEIRPSRPSAKHWVGHADAVDLSARKLWEVKAPRAGLFARAKGDPEKLVRESYRWQAAAYFYELERLATVTMGSWIFLDREGSHAPVEVPMAGMLPSLEAVVARETDRTRLLTAPEAPARHPGTLEIRVWKGERASKKNAFPKRRVEAFDMRYRLCSYCPFQSVCRPAPEERTRALDTIPSGCAEEAVLAAETAWADGDKTTPQVSVFQDSGGW